MNKGVISIVLLLSLVGNTNMRETPEFRITGYCSCPICTGRWSDGLTATGKKAKVGMIAVDPNVIPLHTWVEIEGLGVYQAEDTGSAIKGLRVDIFFEDHNEALKFGIKYRKVRW